MMSLRTQDMAMLEALWDYYDKTARTLPWRRLTEEGTVAFYDVLVSELMLQQTQVSRVIPKFNEFIKTFPRLEELAKAPLADVLRVWVGLGYNRRARYLHEAAKELHAKKVTSIGEADLVQLKGIGVHTARAILVYSRNEPRAFIETNVRTVYIHHYYEHARIVSDAQIMKHLLRTLDKTRPREFYWALMDYGTHLKQISGNVARKSTTYAKQTTFVGSKRQLRGRVINLLANSARPGPLLHALIQDQRLSTVLLDLENERLVVKQNGVYHLPLD